MRSEHRFGSVTLNLVFVTRHIECNTCIIPYNTHVLADNTLVTGNITHVSSEQHIDLDRSNIQLIVKSRVIRVFECYVTEPMCVLWPKQCVVNETNERSETKIWNFPVGNPIMPKLHLFRMVPAADVAAIAEVRLVEFIGCDSNSGDEWDSIQAWTGFGGPCASCLSEGAPNALMAIFCMILK